MVVLAIGRRGEHLRSFIGMTLRIKDTYRWQVCNEGYERAAIRQLSDRWPDILPKFQEYNAGILGRKDKPVRGESHLPSDPPPTGVLSPTVVQGSVVQIPELQRTGVQDSDTGARGLQGEGEVADTRDAPFEGAPGPASIQEIKKGNSKPTPSRKESHESREWAVTHAIVMVDGKKWTIGQAVEWLVNPDGFTSEQAHAALGVGVAG